MPFNWPLFLTARHIHYVTSGPNIRKDEIGVKCPFCGRADPSEHMAILIDGGGWSCRRNKSHSGKSAARLVAALLNCGIDQAHSIVGTRRHLQPNVAAVVNGLLAPPKTEDKPRRLDMPKEFKPFVGGSLEKPFTNYLVGRGFHDPIMLSRRYDLHYAMRGPDRYRIIFPVYFERQLVSWTGRTISNHPARYKTLSVEPTDESPAAIGPISDYLLWYDDLLEQDADTIILVEGPFDALKINVLGVREGICSTCFFRIDPTDAQIDLLHTLLPRFRRRFLLQDRGAEATALATHGDLAALKVGPLYLPPGIGDAGALTAKAWRDLTKEI